MKRSIKIIVKLAIFLLISGLIIGVPLVIIDAHFDEENERKNIKKLSLLYSYVDDRVDLSKFDNKTARQMYEDLVMEPVNQKTWLYYKEFLDEYAPEIAYGSRLELITPERMLNDTDGVYEELFVIADRVYYSAVGTDVFKLPDRAFTRARKNMPDEEFKVFEKAYINKYIMPTIDQEDVLYYKKEILNKLYRIDEDQEYLRAYSDLDAKYETTQTQKYFYKNFIVAVVHSRADLSQIVYDYLEKESNEYEKLMQLNMTQSILDSFKETMDKEYSEIGYGSRYETITQEKLINDYYYVAEELRELHRKMAKNEDDNDTLQLVFENIYMELNKSFDEKEKEMCDKILRN